MGRVGGGPVLPFIHPSIPGLCLSKELNSSPVSPLAWGRVGMGPNIKKRSALMACCTDANGQNVVNLAGRLKYS